MNTQRQYELVYLVSPDASDDQVAEVQSEIEQIIKRFDGELVRSEDWGRRKLAYDIAHKKEATYILDVIKGTGELVKEVDRRLKVTEPVIRHLIVRVDEELKAAERARARRKSTVPVSRPPEAEVELVTEELGEVEEEGGHV